MFSWYAFDPLIHVPESFQNTPALLIKCTRYILLYQLLIPKVITAFNKIMLHSIVLVYGIGLRNMKEILLCLRGSYNFQIPVLLRICGIRLKEPSVIQIRNHPNSHYWKVLLMKHGQKIYLPISRRVHAEKNQRCIKGKMWPNEIFTGLS